MNADIGVKDGDKDFAKQILDEVLANTYVLYVKTQNYHWNVTGKEFPQYHEFLEQQYTELAAAADEIAEMTRTYERNPISTMKQFIETAEIKEDPDYPDAGTMIENLAKDHETIIKSLREKVRKSESKENLQGLADFLTALMEKHMKTAWMLRATAAK